MLWEVIMAVADPGFPIGGCRPVGGAANLRRVHCSVKTYAKTKEIDPVGGHMPAVPPWICQCMVVSELARLSNHHLIFIKNWVPVRPDLGFSIGSADPIEGTTPDAVSFRRKCMSRRQNWVPPLDPPPLPVLLGE